MQPKFLSWQAGAIAALCVADLISTILLCRYYDAAEANPLMAYFLGQGVTVFAVAKLFLTAVPLSVLEWARHVRPRVGYMALNTVLLGYMTLYAAGLAHVNRGIPSGEAAEWMHQDPAHTVYLETQRRIAAKRSGEMSVSAGDHAAIVPSKAVGQRVADTAAVTPRPAPRPSAPATSDIILPRPPGM